MKMDRKFGISRLGTGLWITKPARRQTYFEAQWDTWDKALGFAKAEHAAEHMREFNLSPVGERNHSRQPTHQRI